MDIRALITSAFEATGNPLVQKAIAAIPGAAHIQLALEAGRQANALLEAFRTGQINAERLKQDYDRMVDEGVIIDAATAVEARKRDDSKNTGAKT